MIELPNLDLDDRKNRSIAVDVQKHFIDKMVDDYARLVEGSSYAYSEFGLGLKQLLKSHLASLRALQVSVDKLAVLKNVGHVG